MEQALVELFNTISFFIAALRAAFMRDGFEVNARRFLNGVSRCIQYERTVFGVWVGFQSAVVDGV